MIEGTSKYGFFIVICVHEDGKKDLAYRYDEQIGEISAQFKSENEAIKFVKVARENTKKYNLLANYYHKYVSWSMYD